MFVIFVSHQWLSSNHPDPEGEQALRGLVGYRVWGLGFMI